MKWGPGLESDMWCFAISSDKADLIVQNIQNSAGGGVSRA